MLAELGGGMDEEDAEMADLAKTVKAMGNIFFANIQENPDVSDAALMREMQEMTLQEIKSL